MGIKIIGTGRALPKKEVPNNRLSEFLDTGDEWISARTGIRSRRVVTDETLADLAGEAAKKALLASGIGADNIDLILCSTLGGSLITPALACSVQKRIGAHCPAFDLNAACSGFLFALDAADAYITSKKAEHILIVAAEEMSRRVDWNDRSTAVLFGDGAGAAVVTRGNALQYIHLTTEANEEIISLTAPGGNSPFRENTEDGGFLRMQGREVYKFAVGTVEKEIKRALIRFSIFPEEIDHYILHQANKRIIDAIRERLSLPEERFPLNIQNFGNISSASIPVLLDEMLEKRKIRPGQKLLLCAFGGGMTTGSCILRWE